MENENKKEISSNLPVMRCSNEWNFKDGKQISKTEIKRWHGEVLDAFVKDIRLEHHIIRSGNGLVMGMRNMESGEITVFEIDNGYHYFRYEAETE